MKSSLFNEKFISVLKRAPVGVYVEYDESTDGFYIDFCSRPETQPLSYPVQAQPSMRVRLRQWLMA